MPLDFKFPDVGEGTTEGTLVKWLVKEGDSVKADQPLAEIETDKAVVEIPSPRVGVILKLYGKPGEVIKVGNVLATIGDPGEVAGGAPAPAAAPAPKASSAPAKSSTPAPVASKQAASGVILATPSTRQLARKLGVDLATVKGTGSGGRISDDDVQKAASVQNLVGKTSPPKGAPPAPMVLSAEPSTPSVPVPDDQTRETMAGTHVISPLAHPEAEKQAWKSEGTEERVPLKGIRKVISDRMVKSMFTAVQVTHMDECDVTALVELRAKEKPRMEKKGIKLTFMPFIIKACAAALQNHPFVNASIDDSTQEIVLKKYFHMGVAVDTEDGLMVPVIRNCDQKSIVQIAQEVQNLAVLARDRKIPIGDLKGSTFSITNVGSLGGTYSTPVINWPEVAILGVGTIADRPVVRDGKIVIRSMCTFSLTFDHRILDGAQAVRFLNEVMEHLEDPSLFLLDVI